MDDTSKMIIEQPVLEDDYRMVNKYVLTTPYDNAAALSNGLKVREERGRKDIICGVVELSEPSLKISPKSMCWYPASAAVKVTLPVTVQGRPGYRDYLAVPYEDIIIVEATIK